MTEFIDAVEFEKQLGDDELDNVPRDYREIRDAEGIPVHTGAFVEDVNELETDYWERTGQRGAIINLYGNEGVNDMHVHELEPAGETQRHHHLYDELVYVSEGQGLTALGPADDETIFEWSTHSLFLIPSNVPHRHVNASDDSSARLLAETPLPQLTNDIKNPELIMNPNFHSWDDYSAERYSEEGALREGPPGSFPVIWEANFVPNVKEFDKLETWASRGAGGISIGFDMPNSSMPSHISEFPVGRYKKAHRHQPGACVLVLSGAGYSLMWREGMDQIVKVDWKPGSIVVPPARWFHQHFNTGDERARYFALRAARLGALGKTDLFSIRADENQIEYVEEDPAIRELFERELAAEGLETNMPDESYTDPDYEFSS